MLRIDHPRAAAPDGLSRREWLRLGAVGSLSLANLLEARANPTAPAAARRTRACIQLFFLGGPPQQETWDPKPSSPVEARGNLQPIASSVPGILVGELMPRTARLLQHIAVLRAVTTGDSSHSSSGYYMTTGQPHTPIGAENARPGAPNHWPCMGAIVRKVWPHPTPLPAAITLPEQSANDGNLTWPGQDAGWLGRSFDPWLISCTPEAANFAVPGLGLPPEVPPQRFEQRLSLMEQVNRQFAAQSERTANYSIWTRQAYDLLGAEQARRAFNLEAEAPRVRDRYGRTRFGQSCLLARRLVEAGVPLIRINWTRVAGAHNNGHWDTHSRNTDGLRQLMPIMDAAYSALLEDLHERGLLDDTLVVWMGEFGRTPRFNGGGGRDHWGNVFSVALAGGGIRGGTVYGASDGIAAYPRDGRVTPPDLHATIYQCLGLPPDSEFHDQLNRPLPLTRGTPIRAVLA